MPGRQRPGKLNRRRVVHKSTGGMLNPIREPVDPVGKAPSSSLNTVAHLDPLPEGVGGPGQGEGLDTKNYSVGAGMGRIGAGVSL